MPLESIRTLMRADLLETNNFIVKQFESRIPLIKEMVEYVLSCGGKRIRPLILLLAARALDSKAVEHIHLAAVIELIHTATLLHDDVVDGSTLRRGHQTAHTIWGSDASVLIGDFLYSRAFQVVVDLNNQPVLHLFAAATHYIAEGEILQLVNCHNADTTEEFYFDIIQRKTGKLFELATELAARVATDDVEKINALATYGRHLGLAYQLIDDALDYSQSAKETGKNVGQDIDEGKATLPLIYAMQQSSGKELTLLKTAIAEGETKNIKQVLRVIESTQAIKYTADAAKSHALIAKNALSILPDNPYRQALIDLSDFVVNRSY